MQVRWIFKLIPNKSQSQTINDWLITLRKTRNYGLREYKQGWDMHNLSGETGMLNKSDKPAKRKEITQINDFIGVIKLNPSVFILGIVFGFAVGFVFTEPFYKVPSLPNFFQQSQSNS